MLFSEIYGSYFNVVAAVLSEASDGKLTDRRMTELVREKAFAESALAIPAALKSGTWPLLDQEYHSILHHKPTMPLTMLQKRWLKALLSDPRIALFDPDTTGLEDVDPLYRLYQIRLRYDKDDETELLIRVLSFGPVLEVIEPSAFVTLMRKRIAVQKQRFCQ